MVQQKKSWWRFFADDSLHPTTIERREVMTAVTQSRTRLTILLSACRPFCPSIGCCHIRDNYRLSLFVRLIIFISANLITWKPIIMHACLNVPSSVNLFFYLSVFFQSFSKCTCRWHSVSPHLCTCHRGLSLWRPLASFLRFQTGWGQRSDESRDALAHEICRRTMMRSQDSPLLTISSVFVLLVSLLCNSVSVFLFPSATDNYKASTV